MRRWFSIFPHIAMLPLLLGWCCLPLRLLADEGKVATQPEETQSAREQRHDHSDRPTIPQPQRPELSTPENRDTHRPFLDWQHVTGDWWGVRPWLDDRGVVWDATWTMDVSRNARGGVSTRRTISRHLWDVNLTGNTDRLFGWPGGTVFVDFQSFRGATGDEIVGDYQIFSNIDTLPITQVPQMWFEQRIWYDTVRLKVGMVDANSEFAYTTYGADFLNSSMGFSPTIFVLPTYPDPSTSINVFWHPLDAFYLGVGLYDGAGQRGVPTGSRGPRSLLGEKLFTIGEVGVRWQEDDILPGRCAFGLWYHNGDFQTFAGSTQAGTGGWYALMEQQLYRENACDQEDEQGLGLFVQYGQANPAVSEVCQHVGLGLSWQGCFPGRDEDTLGVGVTWVRFSESAGLAYSSEASTEVFYKLMLTRWAALTFDVQYIRHPGGVAGRRDALVGTTRVLLQF